MLHKHLGLALILAVMIASPHDSSCCNSRNRDDEQTKPAVGPTIRISGSVLLNPAPQRLPANARLDIRVEDISLMDAPSKLLSRKVYASVSAAYASGGKIPFSLEAIIPAETPFLPNTVAVSASLGGTGVSYITDTAYYVDLRPNTFDYSNMEITIIKYP